MKIEEKKRDDIEKRASKMSDFLRMEYFEGCLKQADIEIEAKKYCHAELAKIYADKRMFGTAAKQMAIAAELAYTYREKIDYYLKEAELRILAEDYDLADRAIQNVIRDAGEIQNKEVRRKINSVYRKQAEHFELMNQNSKALKIYEKLVQTTDDAEKPALKGKLLALYEKLGKIREFMALKGKIV